jgi:predicted RNase H-like HicB family nuclease
LLKKTYYKSTKIKDGVFMAFIINLNIEELPEGFYLATSSQVQGLVAQGRTINETIDIAKDVARKLLEARQELSEFKVTKSKFKYPLVMEM